MHLASPVNKSISFLVIKQRVILTFTSLSSSSCSTVLIFVIYLVISIAYKKKNPSDTVYPEGDALIEDWKEYDEPVVADKEGTDAFIKSILDSLDEEDYHQENNEISGGFKIDSSLFDEEKSDET